MRRRRARRDPGNTLGASRYRNAAPCLNTRCNAGSRPSLSCSHIFRSAVDPLALPAGASELMSWSLDPRSPSCGLGFCELELHDVGRNICDQAPVLDCSPRNNRHPHRRARRRLGSIPVAGLLKMPSDLRCCGTRLSAHQACELDSLLARATTFALGGPGGRRSGRSLRHLLFRVWQSRQQLLVVLIGQRRCIVLLSSLVITNKQRLTCGFVNLVEPRGPISSNFLACVC